MATLRLLIQLLRSFNGKSNDGEQSEAALDLYINNPSLKSVLQQAAYNSKVPAVQAGAL